MADDRDRLAGFDRERYVSQDPVERVLVVRVGIAVRAGTAASLERAGCAGMAALGRPVERSSTSAGLRNIGRYSAIGEPHVIEYDSAWPVRFLRHCGRNDVHGRIEQPENAFAGGHCR